MNAPTSIQPDFNAPARLLLGLGFVLGFCMLVIVPPFAVPDEGNHFLKAYQLSEGKLFAHREHGPGSNVGDEFPSSLWDTLVLIQANVMDDRDMHPSLAKISAAMRIRLQPEARHFRPFPNMALYSPVPYLPAAAAMAIPRWAGASPILLFYIGRLANLTAYILLAWCAVLITPILRTGFALVAMVPMSLFLAASLSADSVTLGLALVAIAATLKMAVRDEPVTNWALARLTLFYILLALSKQAYAPLMLLFFIVPKSKCGSRWRYASCIALVVVLPIALNFAWAMTVKPLYYPMMRGADPAAQLRFTFSRPFDYTAEMVKAMFDEFQFNNILGVLSWLSVLLPKTVLRALWISLALSAILDGTGSRSLTLGRRLVVLGISVLSIATIITLVNLSWQTVGNKGIAGLQPRYFLPLVPSLLIMLRVDRRLPWAEKFYWLNPLAIIAVALLGSITSWVMLFERFYL